MKVRKGAGEEILLVQGKEQWLGFAGVALKRYPNAQGKRNPSKMVGVARGHQRVDTLQPYSQKTLLGRKAKTNLDSILKSRDITLPTKVRLVKAMDFPLVMYGCESWTVALGM